MSFLWIGLNDNVEEGTFVWSDGTKVTYEDWMNENGDPEPNGGKRENCVVIHDGGWADTACDSANYFLCEL